jgi:hypothetical protein
MDRIEEAFGHLAGALMQAIPSDDQIIIQHMQEAHDLLRAELRERRACALTRPLRPNEPAISSHQRSQGG